MMKRWALMPKDGNQCQFCGKPCRMKYCTTNHRVQAYQRRKTKA
jgi:hypothetical protein